MKSIDLVMRCIMRYIVGSHLCDVLSHCRRPEHTSTDS